MGFGLLFIGYFMATFMSMSPLGGVFLRVFGYALVFVAAIKLKQYNRDFKYLGIGSAVMIAISSVIVFASISGQISLSYIFTDTVKNILGHVERIGYLGFTAAMCFSVRSIATETDLPKISVASMRNFIFTVIYSVLYAIAYLPFVFLKDYGKYFGTPVFILYIVIIFMNSYLLLSCYARICDESDAQMAIKPSRFAFVNRFREENEKRRAEAEERYEKKRKEKAERRRNGK